MNAEGVVEQLYVATKWRADADGAALRASLRQAQAIRVALAAGVSTADVMAVTGLSRARIYQIRDGRR